MQQSFSRQFPRDIWVLFIEALYNPIPPALSKPSRDALRNPHLAVLMRVNRSVHDLCEKKLYLQIATDSLPTLLRYSDLVPGRRFALTKRLHVEYQPKGEHPTYRRLFETYGAVWEDFAPPEAEKEKLFKEECEQEAEDLEYCLGRNTGGEDFRHMGPVFPNLETVSIDAIYSAGADIWPRYAELSSYHTKLQLVHCIYLFNKFLISGVLYHVCSRPSNGPFGLRSLTFASELESITQMTDYTQTIHFSPNSCNITLPLGTKVTWVSDASPQEDFAKVLQGLAANVDHQLRTRVEANEGYLGTYGALPRDVADVDIYCSTNQYGPSIYDDDLVDADLCPLEGERPAKFVKKVMTKAEKEEMVGKLQAKIQKQFRELSGMEDKFRWRLSEEAPRCLACP